MLLGQVAEVILHLVQHGDEVAVGMLRPATVLYVHDHMLRKDGPGFLLFGDEQFGGHSARLGSHLTPLGYLGS